MGRCTSVAFAAETTAPILDGLNVCRDHAELDLAALGQTEVLQLYRPFRTLPTPDVPLPGGIGEILGPLDSEDRPARVGLQLLAYGLFEHQDAYGLLVLLAARAGGERDCDQRERAGCVVSHAPRCSPRCCCVTARWYTRTRERAKRARGLARAGLLGATPAVP